MVNETTIIAQQLSGPTLTAVQAIAVAALVFAGQYLVARLSKRAQSEATKVDSQAEATKAWQEYAIEMRKRLDALERQVEQNRLQQESDRLRIAALERQSDIDKDLIRRLVSRFRALVEELRKLGREVALEDSELIDLAQLRLDLKDNH